MSNDEIKFIREILKSFSPKLLFCLNWQELLFSFFKIGKRAFEKTRYLTFENNFKTEDFLFLINKKNDLEPLNLEALSREERELFYRKLVKLYFTQFFKGGPLYFHFLESFFYTSDSSDLFFWKPLKGFESGVVLDERFRKGLIELYTGLYEENQSLSTKGLIKMGLLNELADISQQEERDREIRKHEELFSIVDKHFGMNTKDYKFTLSHLALTMEKMTSFIIKYKIKLDSNFIILGLCLTSLYLCLKENEQGLNLDEIFLEASS